MSTVPAPPSLGNLITRETGALLAMIARRSQPWPESSDVFVELSARFVAVGLGIPRMRAWRLLKQIAPLIGWSSMRSREAKAAGLELVGGSARRSRGGTVYRIPGAVARVLAALLGAGAIDWHPPATSRTWWTVAGLDPQKARGTCRCPHPHHDGDRPRCAYERHMSGSWHLTCQVCEDGTGRPLTFFARRNATGDIEASLTHRAHVAGGRDGQDDLHGWTSAEHAIRSKRALGIPLSWHEEQAVEKSRAPTYQPPVGPPAPPSQDGASPGARISLSHRDTGSDPTVDQDVNAQAVPAFASATVQACAFLAAVGGVVQAARDKAAACGPWRRPLRRRRRPDDKRAGQHRSGAPPTRHTPAGDPWVLVDPGG